MGDGFGRLKKQWREQLFAKQEGRCHYCGGQMSLTNRVKNGGPARDFATFEHLTPRVAGGKLNSQNIVLAHRKCNTAQNIKWQSTMAIALDRGVT